MFVYGLKKKCKFSDSQSGRYRLLVDIFNLKEGVLFKIVLRGGAILSSLTFLSFITYCNKIYNYNTAHNNK